MIAVLSIFAGSLGGLEQRKLKSLFAYSLISHTGYLLLSFSTATSEGSTYAFILFSSVYKLQVCVFGQFTYF